MEAQPVQHAPPAPATQAAAPGSVLTIQLNQLVQFHASGVLTDDGFTAARKKLLAGG